MPAERGKVTGYEIKTKVLDNCVIDQEVLQKVDGVVVNTTKYILDLQQEGVRKALIDLGWTPPKEGR